MHILIVLLIFATVATVVGCSPDRGTIAPGDPQTSSETPKDSTSLSAVANNPSASQADRSRAVFSLFARFIPAGSSSKAVQQVIGDAKWLNDVHIEGVYALGGLIPVEFDFDSTVFAISLFPENAGDPWSPWLMYVRLSGQLKEAQAIAFLHGEADDTVNLVEYALCFANSSNPGQFIGRIERFSRDGMRVYEE